MTTGGAPAGSPRLPLAFARRQGVLLAGWEGDTARLAVREGAGATAIAEARRHLGAAVRLEQVPSEAFDRLLQQAYESGADARSAAGGLEERIDLDFLAQDLPEQADLLESEDAAPIIRLINALLTQAVRDNASDIHIEPFENRLVVRMRVDGVMRESLQTKRAVAAAVVSRIKVMSKLDIAEKRLPQDGRIGLRVAGRAIDVRVSTIPAGHGERVVLRLLDKQAGRLDLGGLGMDPASTQLIDTLIHRPNGILLVTGPTGSGKTTTLYAALGRLNDATRNIMTVEDPIEYYIDGIGQTQVNPRVDMSFARGLRAILRQDPDIVITAGGAGLDIDHKVETGSGFADFAVDFGMGPAGLVQGIFDPTRGAAEVHIGKKDVVFMNREGLAGEAAGGHTSLAAKGDLGDPRGCLDEVGEGERGDHLAILAGEHPGLNTGLHGGKLTRPMEQGDVLADEVGVEGPSGDNPQERLQVLAGEATGGGLDADHGHGQRADGGLGGVRGLGGELGGDGLGKSGGGMQEETGTEGADSPNETGASKPQGVH